MNKSDERPGTGIMRIWLIPFIAFSAAGLLVPILMNRLLVESSYVLFAGFVSLYIFHFLTSKLLLYRWTKSARFTLLRHNNNNECIPIYSVKDRLANAAAVGMLQRNSYILVSDTLVDILDEDEFESIIEHEVNHIKYEHNLIVFSCGALLWTVMLLIIQTFPSEIVPILLGSVPLFVIGTILIRNIQRGNEDVADRVSSAKDLHSALVKIDSHNKSIVNKPVIDNELPNQGNRSDVLATHPTTILRPRKPNTMNQVVSIAIFVSIMAAFSIFVRTFAIVGSEPVLVILLFFIAFSTVIASTIIGLLNYLFLESFIVLLAQKMKIENFDAINASNGILAFLVITTLPYVLGTSSESILNPLLPILGIVAAGLVTAAGSSPALRANIASIIAWTVCGILYILAFMVLGIVISTSFAIQ
ncbi:MAG: M48 family metallopeptidase [Candidatus Thorarchaeota archaeon]